MMGWRYSSELGISRTRRRAAAALLDALALRTPGRMAALAGLGVLVLLRLVNPPIIEEIRQRMFDVGQYLFPRDTSHPVQPPVRIVEIDSDSIREFGQWPWPRTLVATLIEQIARTGPKVLGIDILFATPDRLSPPELAKELPKSVFGFPHDIAARLAAMPSNDARLAQAIRKIPTVLGVALIDRQPALEDSLPIYRSGETSIESIRAAAVSDGGLISVAPDYDGVLRRVPVAAYYKDSVRATTYFLGFAAQLIAQATRAFANLRRYHGKIEGLDIGNYFIPTDESGAAFVYFGPRLPSYSAAQLLDGAFNPDDLHDAIVLLGLTGIGTVDLQRTPIGLLGGIEFHAQLIQSVLNNTVLWRPWFANWIEIGAVLFAGFVVIWTIRYEAPVIAAAVAFALVTAFVGGEAATFKLAHWLIDGIYPAGSAIVCFGIMLGGSLIAVQRDRRRISAELEREAGELAAARDIQMGLLPLRFPAFPGRSEIDLYARIEPARDVGGDLFDFHLFDQDRLFFMIGDVSGKGIPAALFMAMTREIVRDAARQHGAALDRILADANTKILSASNDMLDDGHSIIFVTAFACVLDLLSGELVYCSAGHDSPLVVEPGRTPRALVTEGGPPLGTIADFPYPVDRDHLGPGSCLILFTDGVTEAQDTAGALYSGRRLAACIEGAPMSARQVVDTVFTDVRNFTGAAIQADDITVLVVRRPSSHGNLDSAIARLVDPERRGNQQIELAATSNGDSRGRHPVSD
jgi:adenylate cyclase